MGGQRKAWHLSDVTIEARLREQRVTIHLNGRGLRYSFSSDWVAVEDEQWPSRYRTD
jgi:hypothetical protein